MTTQSEIHFAYNELLCTSVGFASTICQEKKSKRFLFFIATLSSYCHWWYNYCSYIHSLLKCIQLVIVRVHQHKVLAIPINQLIFVTVSKRRPRQQKTTTTNHKWTTFCVLSIIVTCSLTESQNDDVRW